MSKEVSSYQCSGCIHGSSTEDGCYKKRSEKDISCRSHIPATITSMQGKILLGMPKGFNQLGPWTEMPLNIFATKEDFESSWGYNKLNLPVWKYKNKEGHVFIRGMCPRRNMPFLHVVLDASIYETLNCQEITEKDFETMD